MPINTGKYRMETAVSASRQVQQKIEDVRLRCLDAQAMGQYGPSADVVEVIGELGQMWGASCEWLMWRKSSPPPDPATTVEDWPEPQQTIDYSRRIAAIARQMADRLAAQADRWDAYNAEIAAFRVRQRETEERRIEQGILNRLRLPMEQGDAAILALRELPTHQERMQYLESLMEAAEVETTAPLPEPTPDSIMELVRQRRTH